ncbi:MAG: hypothetical protein LBG21_01110 [Campylobacteraceae bacterium]|jgi:hypothetical protein|nr:hypothetical protein [Campylobacteraceae bacterium]
MLNDSIEELKIEWANERKDRKEKNNTISYEPKNLEESLKILEKYKGGINEELYSDAKQIIWNFAQFEVYWDEYDIDEFIKSRENKLEDDKNFKDELFVYRKIKKR